MHDGFWMQRFVDIRWLKTLAEEEILNKAITFKFFNESTNIFQNSDYIEIGFFLENNNVYIIPMSQKAMNFLQKHLNIFQSYILLTKCLYFNIITDFQKKKFFVDNFVPFSWETEWNQQID